MCNKNNVTKKFTKETMYNAIRKFVNDKMCWNKEIGSSNFCGTVGLGFQTSHLTSYETRCIAYFCCENGLNWAIKPKDDDVIRFVIGIDYTGDLLTDEEAAALSSEVSNNG